MFADLENVQAIPRRGWPALVSFTLQAAAVATALAIPLLYPNSMPDALAPRRIFVPITGPTSESAPPSSHPSSGGSATLPSAQPIFVTQNTGFHFPIPGQNTDAGGIEAPPIPGAGFGFAGPGPNLGTDALPVIHPVLAAPIRVSRSMQSYLIRRVEPRYPEIAIAARMQGPVLIKALISVEGKIVQAQVVSGSPLLSAAALDAIKQWRYRPYILNDKPVEVETEITVSFYLTR